MSRWRSQRLVILCYHGISFHDEHLWNPGLFMERRKFESRMEHLKAYCNVLPLADGIDRLSRGELPERSVAVTFDDGWYDFYEIALPILLRLGIPATVYLTTYYVDYNRPVFDPMLGYLLWRANGQTLALRSVIPDAKFDTEADPFGAITNYVRETGLNAAAKDQLLSDLARNSGIDYDALLERRILHLMNSREVEAINKAGIDVQMHTHRHRLSSDPSKFAREITENRAQIELLTGKMPTHFCYPNGNFLPQYDEWLADLSVVSATTCECRLCHASDNARSLPRILDSQNMTATEFEAWVSGFAQFLPQRRYAPGSGQFIEDWAPSSNLAGALCQYPDGGG